jgi:oligoribonuclease NrnB/cAMP/cGMP phosphodiesterase (DHH superfamily)
MKVFIISHISDPDGITPVILARLVFDEVHSVLYEVLEVNEGVTKLIDDHAFDNYDKVYITDLGVNEEVLKLIEKDEQLKNKLLLFDHHIGNEIANNYSFATVIDTDEHGQKQSGTSLFYNHLLNNYNNPIISTGGVNTFVNLVREYDTWEWTKTNNDDAKKLANLFELYGREYFEKHYISFLRENESFYFTDNELFLLDIVAKQIASYIEEKKKAVIPITILGHRAGLVFASQHRSELGNALAKHFVSSYAFIIIINVERSVSYRGISDIDLNEVATVFGGKGHFHSSGSPLPEHLHEHVIKAIFGDKVTLDTKNFKIDTDN